MNSRRVPRLDPVVARSGSDYQRRYFDPANGLSKFDEVAGECRVVLAVK
jgi:hypothetical protein